MKQAKLQIIHFPTFLYGTANYCSLHRDLCYCCRENFFYGVVTVLEGGIKKKRWLNGVEMEGEKGEKGEVPFKPTCPMLL